MTLIARPILPLALLLSGCDLLADLAGATNPTVMEAMLIGVEPPDSDLVDLTGTEFEGGTGATVLLADATQADDLEEAPIEGARVDIQIGGRWYNLRDDADGKYIVDEGISYPAGEEVTVRIRDGEERGASVRAPESLDLEIVESHSVRSPLVVRAETAGLDTIAVVVMEVESGEILYDNRPATIEEVYALTHGDGSLAVEVPGTAFPRPGAYVIGVAGLAISEAEGLENVNTTISAFAAGTIRFWPVYVADLEAGE